MDFSRVNRLLRLITLLRTNRSMTARDLAEALEISRRTVFRDLNMLELAGVPYYIDEQSGGYRIADTFFLPPVNLTLDEALSLMTLAAQSSQLPLHKLADHAAAKIASILPRPIQDEVNRSLKAIQVAWPPQARHQLADRRFAQVQQAIVARRRLRITYVSFFERSQIVTELSPYHLFYYQRAWYVVGHSQMHRSVRTFKLGRVKDLAVLEKLFVPDEKFTLEKYFGNAWGMIPEGREYRVRLRFSAKVAANVAEVNWHPTQQVVFDTDGSCVFEATVDGLGEISWWILGYGDQVEVLAPVELRRKIRDMAQAIVDRHSDRPKRE